MSREIDFKKRVELAYDSSSGTYDDAVRSRMVQYSRLLLGDLQIPESPKVLDVGCGTGISTFELVKKCEGKGKFCGIDISQKMIDKARETASELGYSNVEFRQGDAEKLDFPDSSFDLVISNQAFHWFPNKLKALSEMYRVLKPKGQIALIFNGDLHGSKEAADIFFKIARRHPELRDIRARIASARLISLEDAHELFEKIGFRDSRIFALHRIMFIDPAMFLRHRDATAAVWQTGIPPTVVEKLKKEWLEEARKVSTNKGLKKTSYDIIAYGTKPRAREKKMRLGFSVTSFT